MFFFGAKKPKVDNKEMRRKKARDFKGIRKHTKLDGINVRRALAYKAAARRVAIVAWLVVGVVSFMQVASAGTLSCMKYDGAKYFECLSK